MANFQIYETKEDISAFDLPLNRDVKLRQYGGDRDGNRLEVTLAPGGPGGVDLTVLPEKLDAASTAFNARGTRQGAYVEISAFVAGSGQTQYYSKNLGLTVHGAPTKNAGYDVDLLSNLAISGNGAQILTYTRIFHGSAGKSNMLSQDPDKPVLDCGDVAGAYGAKLFGKATNTDWIAYYLPPKTSKRADLRFEPGQMRAKIARIKRLLDQNISVRVWVVDDDGFSIPFIQSNANNTHFITLIGYAASKFMMIDPWPGGSSLNYDGGMYTARKVNFLGELVFDPMDLDKGIHSPATVGGIMSYTVIAGPQ
ncbi:hypothetical protein [Mesorhizobium sp. CN2-181]|uniref:hypothetical protein n=1 Tax=Mesorhizobium yinganensis TaxID=3157707 RepID=UPI0032B77AAC